MTAGIRSFTNDNFVKYLPELAALGNAGFRAKVMGETITKFSISIASAATHYNHSLKQARINNPKSVAGLGRPEDKKGGRKPVTTVTVIKVKTGEVVVEGVSKGAAELLIAKAAAAKNKPKLAIKTEVETPAEAATA